MARIKGGVNAKKKHRKILRHAKGYFGARSKLYRTAKEAVMRARKDAYIGRKLKKRDMRKLWITRINAAARINDISYSRFMNGLKKAGVELDRKVLADIAMNDAASFKALAETAKNSLN
ncbi:MAG: 50S ribosomal protein L20 [Eubacteriaceae bacterium]|nr:50S ribosomal protein L20 [Eubacteriaceae bacterium]